MRVGVVGLGWAARAFHVPGLKQLPSVQLVGGVDSDPEQRASWERDRSVGRRLVEAFNESEKAFEALQRQFPYNSPWLIDEVEGAARVMGTSYHTHGIDPNRRAIDTFCQAAFDDGLTKRRVTVDEFFQEFLQS